MDLWIRSQNRKALINVKQIRINGLDIMCLNGELLGTYKTEERALEVLNEIQNILQPKISVKPTIEEDMNPEYIHKHFVSNGKEVDVVELNTYVYEMPKE